MEATGVAVAGSRVRLRRVSCAGWALAHGLNALLGVAALVLLLRSLSGGISASRAPLPFLGAIAALASLAAGIRLAAGRRGESAQRGCVAAVQYGPALALGAALASLAAAGAGAAWLIAAAGVVVLEEGMCLWKLRANRASAAWGQGASGSSSRLAESTAPAAQRWAAGDALPVAPPLRAGSGTVSNESPENVLQQVWRIETSDGSQRWQGWCRTRFEPAARHAVEHLSFCPPFLQTPRVACRPVSGPPVRLRVSRVLPHGASVELRLSSPSSEPTSVTFEFTASVGSM